jgi:hypothetical protein
MTYTFRKFNKHENRKKCGDNKRRGTRLQPIAVHTTSQEKMYKQTSWLLLQTAIFLFKKSFKQKNHESQS